MYRMHSVFLIYFENIRYDFTEFNMVHNSNVKIKQVSHLGRVLDKIKSGQKYRKLKRYLLYSLTVITYFYLHLNQRYPL